MGGFRLLVGASTGPLHLSIDDRSGFARIHPPLAQLAAPFTYDCFFEDEEELAAFISGSGGVPEAEAAKIATEALERVRSLRRLGWWKRLRGREAAALRQFRPR